MASPLGPTQRLVLLALSEAGWNRWWPDPTEWQLASRVRNVACSLEQPAPSDDFYGPLVRLERRGLVERRRDPNLRASRWAITPAGRDALAKEQDRG